jgi:hypothetical protein
MLSNAELDLYSISGDLETYVHSSREDHEQIKLPEGIP